MKRWLAIFALLCLAAWSVGASCNPGSPPNPCAGVSCPTGQHCEGGVCVDDPQPPCPDLGVPWCHETTPPMHCGACKHQPAGERCPVLAPECPKPEPEPKCQPGQNCGCYVKLEITDDWRLMTCTDPKTCINHVCTSPPPAGCSIDGEPGPALPAHVMALGTQVNQAMLTLRPDCSIGGRCVLQEGRQEWQAKVIAKLRATWGLCAGQHAPDTDEIAVATSATAPREGWHVYAGPWDGPGTIVWAPQAARGAYAAPAGPEPTGCTAPLPPPLWGWGHHRLASRPSVEKYTVTPLVGPDAAYCTAIGLDGRRECPPRAECDPTKDNLKCEERSACEDRVVGLPGPPAKPVWSFTGRGMYVYEDNPYNAEVPEAEAGTLTVCNVPGTVCVVVRP